MLRSQVVSTSPYLWVQEAKGCWAEAGALVAVLLLGVLQYRWLEGTAGLLAVSSLLLAGVWVGRLPYAAVYAAAAECEQCCPHAPHGQQNAGEACVASWKAHYVKKQVMARVPCVQTHVYSQGVTVAIFAGLHTRKP